MVISFQTHKNYGNYGNFFPNPQKIIIIIIISVLNHPKNYNNFCPNPPKNYNNFCPNEITASFH